MTADAKVLEHELHELAQTLGGDPGRVARHGSAVVLPVAAAAALQTLLDPEEADRIHKLARCALQDEDGEFAFVPFTGEDLAEGHAFAALLVAARAWGEPLSISRGRRGSWKDINGHLYACSSDDGEAGGQWWIFDIQSAGVRN